MGLFDFLRGKKAEPIPPEALRVWVHRRSHFRGLQLQLERGGQKAGQVFLPLTGALCLTPALATHQGPIFIRKEHLDGLGMDQKEAVARALQNTAALLERAGRDEGLLMWHSPGAEGLAFLARQLGEQLPVKGAPVLMVPREGLTLAAGAEDEVALGKMIQLAEAAFKESDDFVSLRAISYPLPGADPVEWLPPKGHPLRDRFVAAAAHTKKLEAEGEYAIRGPAHSAVIAPMSSGPNGLTAVWMRGCDAVIPRVDRVVLLDTPGSPHPRVEVPFELLVEVLAQAFEPLSAGGGEETPEFDHADLFRLRGVLFPTAEQRSFLAQRAERDAQGKRHEPRQAHADDVLAAWDAGEPVWLEAADDDASQARLETVDRRIARVGPAAIAQRVSRLSAPTQFFYFNSFRVTAAILSMMGKRPKLDAVPAMPEAIDRGAAAWRTELLSSAEIDGLAKHLSELGGDARRLIESQLPSWNPGCLLPMARPPGYSEGQHENERGMASAIAGDRVSLKHFEGVGRPLFDGLTLQLVSDQGQRVIPINLELMPERMRQLAWPTAELGLEARSLQPLSSTSPGVFEGPWHDDFDASRLLLLPKLAAACAVKGRALLFAPTVGRTYVVGEDDQAGIAKALDTIDQHLSSGDATTPYQYRQLLFGAPYVLENGAWVKWAAPAEHPSRSRIEALDQRLEERRKSSRESVAAFARAALQSPDWPSARA